MAAKPAKRGGSSPKSMESSMKGATKLAYSAANPNWDSLQHVSIFTWKARNSRKSLESITRNLLLLNTMSRCSLSGRSHPVIGISSLMQSTDVGRTRFTTSESTSSDEFDPSLHTRSRCHLGIIFQVAMGGAILLHTFSRLQSLHKQAYLQPSF